MKNSILKLVFLATVGAIIFLSGCKKEPLYPTDQLPANVPTIDTASNVGGWGKFVIIDASM